MNRREADVHIGKVNGYVCVCRGVDSFSFYDINILFRNCSDNVVCFVFHCIMYVYTY